MFLVSDNSSSIGSQDENDLLIQEKILNHLVEPGKLFQIEGSPQKIEEFENLEAKIQKLENPKTRNRLAEVTNKPTNYILDTLDKAFEYDGTENLE